MKIYITPAQFEAESALKQLGQDYLLFGGDKPKITNDGLEYNFSVNGEKLIQRTQWATIIGAGLRVERATFYIEVATEFLDGIVPSSLPESTYTDDEGNTVQRTWSEYAPFHTASLDGTKVLVRCVHVAYGATNGNGLPSDELYLWLAEFGFENMLTAAEGAALLASAAYKEV